MLSNFGPSQAERALKMHQFGTTNGSKMGQNHGFPKNNPSLVVVRKLMNTIILSPFLSCSHPLSITSFVFEVS